MTSLWKYGDAVLGAIDRGGADFAWGAMQVKDKHIILPNGAALDYSNLAVTGGEYHTTGRRGASKIYGAKLVENVVQALSRVVLSQAMLKVAARHRVVLTCHDEVVFLAKTEEAQDALYEGLEIMKAPPAWCSGLPLDAEGSFDVRYSK